MFYAIAITVTVLVYFTLATIRLHAETRYMNAQVEAVHKSFELLTKTSKYLGFTSNPLGDDENTES